MGEKATIPQVSEPAGSRWLWFVLACVGIAFLYFVISPTMYFMKLDRIQVQPASAVGSLRAINAAEITYAQTYKAGFSPTLVALAPARGNTQPTASAAGLVDSELASGKKSGYTFVYRPSPPDDTGCIKTYTLLAQPAKYGKTGRWNLFTDESGVIRKTEENRPATAKDQPLP